MGKKAKSGHKDAHDDDESVGKLILDNTMNLLMNRSARTAMKSALTELKGHNHFYTFELERVLHIYWKLTKHAPLNLSQFQYFLYQVFNMINTHMNAYLYNSLKDVAEAETSSYVTVENFVRMLSVFCRGTLEEKIDFAFEVYDLKSVGEITEEQAIEFIQHSYYTVRVDKERSSYDPMHYYNLVLLNKFDPEETGFITYENYKHAVLKHPAILEAFGQIFPDRLTVYAFLTTFTHHVTTEPKDIKRGDNEEFVEHDRGSELSVVTHDHEKGVTHPETIAAPSKLQEEAGEEEEVETSTSGEEERWELEEEEEEVEEEELIVEEESTISSIKDDDVLEEEEERYKKTEKLAGEEDELDIQAVGVMMKFTAIIGEGEEDDMNERMLFEEEEEEESAVEEHVEEAEKLKLFDECEDELEEEVERDVPVSEDSDEFETSEEEGYEDIDIDEKQIEEEVLVEMEGEGIKRTGSKKEMKPWSILDVVKKCCPFLTRMDLKRIKDIHKYLVQQERKAVKEDVQEVCMEGSESPTVKSISTSVSVADEEDIAPFSVECLDMEDKIAGDSSETSEESGFLL